jgi:ubiquinone/menaquinone biosynthesis C-methylase UbiE
MESWETIEKQLDDVKNHSWTSLLQVYGVLKSFFYITESIPFSLIQSKVLRNIKTINKKDLKRLAQILEEVWLLIQQDSERITAGLYPVGVLQPHWSTSHWHHLAQIWFHGYQKNSGKRLQSKDKILDLEDMEALRDIPEHYKQHYNYAGNNFLDPDSISIYELQMELIFLGSFDAMRRLVLAPMKKHYRFSEGEGLRFLEIGCGTGRLTKFIKKAFPKAKITLLDASPIYLKEAQKNLMDYSRIDFIQGDALDLPFKADSFDAVYSSFLLHEMSNDVRKKLLYEAHRVLVTSGWLGVIDFIQHDDCRELNWVLDQHWFVGEEPYMRDFTMNSLSGIFKYTGFSQVSFERGFLGKVVYGEK